MMVVKKSLLNAEASGDEQLNLNILFMPLPCHIQAPLTLRKFLLLLSVPHHMAAHHLKLLTACEQSRAVGFH